jgi:hypothetical protein
VAPRGGTVYGRLAQASSAGRTSGSSEVTLELTYIVINDRGHWAIKSCHYRIDWNYDEDRSRIRTGYGLENITRLRRFALGVLKSTGRGNVAEKMRRLTRSVRLVFDYLRMSENSCACHVK